MNTRHLPNSVALQYSEFMQNCIHPRSDGSNLSFKSKKINGKRYWYLYISVGSTRREHYLGEETDQLLDKIEDEKHAWQRNEDDRVHRERLVNMLIAGGMDRLGKDEGKVLALLERNGLFLAGAVLVGTVAFRAYANMLGITWRSSTGTQDVDLAADHKYTIALPRPRQPINLGQLILNSDLGFFEVPAISHKRPSTSFKIRGKELLVDVLAPMKGRESSRPVHLEDFSAYASPQRYLDYLLEDIQPAVLLHGHGVMVNVPAPGRFAVHKCVLSQRRRAADAAKALKDRAQAEQLFQVLLEDRPMDVTAALEAAMKQDKKFLQLFRSGFQMLDGDIVESSVFDSIR